MAEIYGSFGRVITGSTLGGSIGSLARQILQDKISRIFNAYRDEVAYEGTVLDAENAIGKLNSLLAMVDPNSPAAQDIKEYIDAIRQQDRSRKVNKAINALATQDYSARDYAGLIKTLKSIQSDPTITDSEREAIKAQIATQSRNMIEVLMDQYKNGGSVTVDGKKIDLSLSGGGTALLSTIQGLMTEFPDMQTEFGQKYDIAQAQVIVKEAEFAYTSLNTTNDSVKIKGTEALVAAYKKAYDVLKNSKYDLGESAEALQMMKNVQDTQETLDTLQKNASIKYAQSYMNKGEDKMASYFDAVDDYAKGALGNARVNYMGSNGTLYGAMVSGDVNTIYQYLDAIAAENGGKTSLTINGKTYDISHDGFKNAVVGANGIAHDLFNFVNNNDSVDKKSQDYYKGIANDISMLVKNKEIFAIEDKYDALKKDLERNIVASDGDIFRIQNAYKEYGKQMSLLAGKYSDSAFADNIRAEAYFYINGQEDKNNKAAFYSEQSGNLYGDDFAAAKEFAVQAFIDASSTNKSRLETYVGLDGTERTGIYGREVIQTEYGPVSAPKWAGNGLRLKDPLGRNDRVYQTIELKDQFGAAMGFISIVNGKFVGARQMASKNYQFFKSADLNKFLTDASITPDNLLDRLTYAGSTAWLSVAGLKQTTIPSSGDQFSLDAIRNGQINIPSDSESGISTDLTPEEKAREIDSILKNYKIESDFVYERQAPGTDPLNGFFIILDGNRYRAADILGHDVAYEAYMRKVTYTTPAEDTEVNKSGTPSLGGGPGNTWTPNIQRTPVVPTGGAGTAGMDPAELAYLQRRNAASAATTATRNPTAAATNQSLIDFRAGERASAAPTTAAAKTATVLPPATTTPKATPLAKAVSTTTTSLKPASATQTSLNAFRAGERAPLASTSANRAVSGFFRNSPFKIAL